MRKIDWVECACCGAALRLMSDKETICLHCTTLMLDYPNNVDPKLVGQITLGRNDSPLAIGEPSEQPRKLKAI